MRPTSALGRGVEVWPHNFRRLWRAVRCARLHRDHLIDSLLGDSSCTTKRRDPQDPSVPSHSRHLFPRPSGTSVSRKRCDGEGLQVVQLVQGCAIFHTYMTSSLGSGVLRFPAPEFCCAMDPSGPPLPLSSSLCSPTTTPCSSPQKTSNPSLPLNSTQHDSPEAQCTCPYEPFLSELKAAKTLMGFKLYPVPTLHPFP